MFILNKGMKYVGKSIPNAFGSMIRQTWAQIVSCEAAEVTWLSSRVSVSLSVKWRLYLVRGFRTYHSNILL